MAVSNRIDWSRLAERLHAAALDGAGWEPALQAFAQATGSRSAQLCGLQDAALTTGALEALQCAAFICDRRGYVRAMTPAAQLLVSDAGQLSLREHVLCARDAASTRRLLAAVWAAGQQRPAVDRFCRRTVRIANIQGAVATIEVFGLPEQPYELPFWPTVLVVVRDIGQDRDGLAAVDAPSAVPGLSAAVQRRAQRAESALDAVACAAFVLGGAGRVVHHNVAAESMLRQQDGLQLREQRLQATDSLLNGRLKALIASAAAASAAMTTWPGGAIALPRATGKRSLQVMVLPLRLPGALGSAHVLVLVGDPDKPAAIPETVLAGLYGLTRAEVEIANALLSGRTVEQIAEQRGVSTGTLRIQLKSIFKKTETRRQSDLLKLLLSLPDYPLERK